MHYDLWRHLRIAWANKINAMKKIFGLLKDIVGWIFLAAMVAVSLFVLGVIIVLRHDLANNLGLAFTLSAGGIAAVIVLLFLWWICRSYGVRSTTIVFGGFTVLTLLFYVEEDWCGWHAWRSFKHQNPDLSAKLDFVSMSPPPVPDDQNFAMTPIAASSYAAMLDREGHEMIPRNENVVNRLQMCIYGDDDGKNLNAGSWAEGRMTDLRIWQNYYRTLAAKTNLFPVLPQPQSSAADVLLALSKYDAPVEELRHANRLPNSRFPLSYDKPNPAEMLLPHLAALKRCTEMLALRATAELRNNQTEIAAADTLLALQLASKIRTEPVLISQLVRIAMFQLTLQPVWEGLARKQWSEAQLVLLDNELGKLDFLADYDVAMHGELCFGSELIEYFRHVDSPLRELGNLTGNLGESKMPLAVIPLVLGPSGWYDQNHLVIAKFFQKWYFHVMDNEKRTCSPAFVERAAKAIRTEIKPGNPCFVFGSLMLPGLDVAARKFAHAQASIDLARTAIALERYRLVHGEFPDSLNALPPQFIESIPYDVIGGKPLHYRLTDQGQFVLYSVGWNETDDGGVMGYSNGGKSLDITAGDWVWFSNQIDSNQK